MLHLKKNCGAGWIRVHKLFYLGGFLTSWLFYRLAFWPAGLFTTWLFTGCLFTGWFFSGWLLSGGQFPGGFLLRRLISWWFIYGWLYVWMAYFRVYFFWVAFHVSLQKKSVSVKLSTLKSLESSFNVFLMDIWITERRLKPFKFVSNKGKLFENNCLEFLPKQNVGQNAFNGHSSRS